MTVDSLSRGLVQKTTNFRTLSHYLLRPITFLNLAINKLLLVIWFNLKGRLLRLRHALSCKDSIELGLIPLPLHPIHVCFHDKC